MKNAFRLKSHHDRIHISHNNHYYYYYDMIKEEREANKELLLEARKRNNDQSSKNIVFKVRSSVDMKNCGNPSASYCTKQSYCLRKNGKYDAHMITHISDGKHHNLLTFTQMLTVY